jgi:hypothetical protein
MHESGRFVAGETASGIRPPIDSANCRPTIVPRPKQVPPELQLWPPEAHRGPAGLSAGPAARGNLHSADRGITTSMKSGRFGRSAASALTNRPNFLSLKA